MQSPLTQHTRPNLPGPTFLHLLTQFPNQPLAALHSAHHQGFSVLATKPLITLTAPNQNSPLQLITSLPIPTPTPAASGSAGTAHHPPDLLQQLTTALSSIPLAPHHPLSSWIGHISYDIARTLENISPQVGGAIDDLHSPLLHWQLFQQYFLLNHATRSWTLIATSHPTSPPPETTLNEMHHLLNTTPPNPPPPQIPPATLLSSMPRNQYLQKVHRIKNFIAAGDIYQANFAQRWSLHTPASPIDLFRQLMQESPSPYAALLISDPSLGPLRAAISASPELLLHRHHNHLTTQPIKGTRPRNLTNPILDQQLHNQLLHSEKDQAELAMIVDLLRNDLGKIAQFRSIQVTTPRAIEKLPTLWHALATIEADLPNSEFRIPNSEFPPSLASVIRAIMPGGSITGAPKIRAMQIIEQLEPTRRGLYCGAIGALSTSLQHPAATLNIAIRTIQLLGNTAHLHAGSGIVADSNPEEEFLECQHKAAPLLRALNAPLTSLS